MIRLFIFSILSFIFHSANAQCNFTVGVPSDITICSPEQIDLIGSVGGGDPLYVEWTGTNGFSDDDLITADSPENTTTYTLTAFGTTDINLVENGDFELGNTGFTSSYLNGEIFCPVGPFNPYGTLGCEGMYVITDDPSSTHTNFSACGDHTTGSGQMMVVNGSASAINIWCQDIPVNTDTDYLFSAWATSVNPSSPAILRFSINGTLIGSDFGLSGTLCAWENFNSSWNSNSSTTATICITNQNTATGGNDFALDDIEFEEVCKEENSFDVTIAEVLGSLPTSNNIDCDNPTANLQVNPDSPNYMYNWEATFGGSIDGPTDEASATALTQGLYSVTVTDENGCTKKISTSVFGSTALPESSIVGDFSLTCDQNEVTVFSTNTDSDNIYNWIGSSDNSTLPFATYDMGGNFILQITNEFNCTSLIPFSITDNIIQPNYSLIANDTLACIGDTVSISADFLETPVNIQWYDTYGNPLSNEEVANVADVGYYVVEFSYANNCSFTDSVLVVSQVSELDYTLGESPLLNCLDTIQELSIVVNDNYDQISWINDTLISNNSSIDISAPGLYIVEVRDNNGCVTRDSVVVEEDTILPTYVVESSIIDCLDGNGSLEVTTDTLVEVSWTFPDGSTSSEDSINSSIAGDFILLLEGDNGCLIIDTFELEANQDFPVLELEFDSLNCFNPSGSINITSNINGTDYEWTGPNSFISTDSSINVTDPGVYTYTATTSSGCSSTDTVEIIADFIEPTLALMADTITCGNLVSTIILESNADFEITDISTIDIVNTYNDSIVVGTSGPTTITIQSANGCTTTELINVEQNFSLPAFIELSDFNLNCFNEDSTILALPLTDEIVSWFYNGDAFSDNTEVVITQGGTYSIVYTDPVSSCNLVDEIIVEEDFQADALGINSNNIDCSNTIAFIDLVSSQDILSINYNDLILNQESDIAYTSVESGIFNFEVTYTNGCTSTISTSIEIDTIAPSIVTNDVSLPCTDEGVEITVGSDVTNLIYQWTGPDNFNSSNQTNTVNIPGEYQIIINNPLNGCNNSSLIEVIENQTVINANFSIDQPLCPGELGEVTLVDATGGDAPYVFNLFDDMNSPILSEDLIPGMYFADIIDANGCSYSENIEILENEDFFINANENITIPYGSSVTLDTDTDLLENEIGYINWTPATNLSCTNCLDPMVMELLEDSWFYLEVQDLNGCAHFDSVFVRVLVDYNFYEPNIFTPNGDGTNDLFYIHSNAFAANSIISEFSIYDRWGNQVFTDGNFPPNDPEHGWDGSFNGKQVLSGVYAYYVSLELPDGSSQNLVGSVTITR